MGCTSSAPTMVNSSTAEKSIQFEEDMSDNQSKDTDEMIYRAADDKNGKSVLPSCDTRIHVVRNRSTPSLKTEKDDQEDGHYSELINKTNSSNMLCHEEKIPKLENVVGKAVELHISENYNETVPALTAATSEGNKVDKQKQGQDLTIKDTNDEEVNEQNSKIKQDNEKEDHTEEALSPSQSESSRATRWEALADIAAELPPSLTVDPITGQIYAVSK